MIAKLYHTYDLESLAKIVTLFYEEQPADFTYLSFNPIMLQFRRLISDPTIFQHMGRNSSLPGKNENIQDPHFSKDIFHKILK
jgi:alpha-1,3-mannosylglycoprotein beta-1,4-N-acetylglucosaminyltransferase C